MFPLLLVFAVIGYIYWLFYSTFRYWKHRNVPFPEPSGFYGNLRELIKSNTYESIIYKIFYDNYKKCAWIGIYKFHRPCVLIRNIDLIKNILIKDFASFSENDVRVTKENDPIFGRHIINIKGEEWKLKRLQLTAALTSGKLKNLFTQLIHTSKDLVEYLKKESAINSEKGLNARDFDSRYTTEALVAYGFGLKANAFADPNPELKTMGEKLLEQGGLRRYELFCFLFFPSIAKYARLRLVSKDLSDWFVAFIRKTIYDRTMNNIVRNDFLDILISAKQKSGEKEFTELDLLGQAFSFYTDAREPVSVALSFTLYALAKNTDIQRKLRDEIDKFMISQKGELTFETIHEIHYLEMVILESLRMYPPISTVEKKCTKQFTLPSPYEGRATEPGVIIEPGIVILIPIYAIHHDPEYYPEPEKFDPNRFTEKEKKNRSKYVFLPFGDGARKCPGYRYSMLVMKVALYAIISNFEVELNKKTTPDMKFDPTALILTKIGGIHLDFKERSQ